MFTQVDNEKFELANKWLRLQNRNISILQGLRNKGITKIIIYGASEFALRLIEQCENENNVVKIIGIGDKEISSKSGDYKNLPYLTIDDIALLKMENMCVVITAMGFCEEIRSELRKRGISKIISLKEMVNEVFC